MSKPYRAETVETLHTIDEPEGVSWLTGFSLQMNGHPDYEPHQEKGTVCCEDCNRYGVFPVPTQELIDKKKALIGEQGVALAIGDIFSLTLNLDAMSPADVEPVIDSYEPPISDEEFNKIINQS